MEQELLIEELDSSTSIRLAKFLLANAGRNARITFSDVLCCPHLIVPVFALIDAYRMRGMKIVVDALERSTVARALLGSGDERPFGKVYRFDTTDEYMGIFDRVQKEVLKLPNVGKGFRIAFEWCISEVMDNVIQHSGANAGYFMVQYLPKERLLKTSVFDLGRGICAALKASKFSPDNAEDAIRLAVEPNVTSGNGQGNGLFGLREIVKQSRNGRLQITSGGAKYVLTTEARMEPFVGPADTLPGFAGTTLVDFQVVLDDSLSIDRVFDDALPTTDLWLEDHELDEATVAVRVLEIVHGTVSREFGREMRQAVENLIDNERRRVVVDFSGVDMCSSAFVDEFIGKLLIKYQFVNFSRMIGFRSLGGLPALLINHSIKQRLSEEDPEEEAIAMDSTGAHDMGPTGPAVPRSSNGTAAASDVQVDGRSFIVDALP